MPTAEGTGTHPPNAGRSWTPGPARSPPSLSVLTAGPGWAGGRRAGASPPPGESRPAPYIRQRRCRSSPAGQGGACLWRPPTGPAVPAQDSRALWGWSPHKQPHREEAPGGRWPASGPGPVGLGQVPKPLCALVPHLPTRGSSCSGGPPAALPLCLRQGCRGWARRQPRPGWKHRSARRAGDGLPDAELALRQRPGGKGMGGISGGSSARVVPGQRRPLLRAAQPGHPHPGTPQPTQGRHRDWQSRGRGASSPWPLTWAPSGPGRQCQDPWGSTPQASGLQHPIVKPAQDLHWLVVTLHSGPT